MVVFEIYTKESEFIDAGGNTMKIKLRPLDGEYLADLYFVINKINDSGLSDKDPKLMTKEEEALETRKMLSLLDKETVKTLYKLELESLKKSYPTEDEGVLKDFVSQNMLRLMGILFSVNFNSD